jgi:hypothetical protein
MISRTTASLAIVTVLLAIYVFALDHDTSEAKRRNFRVVPIADAADISTLEITQPSGNITLKRADRGRWMMVSPVADRADAQKVEELIATLLELKKLETIAGEDAPADSQMGLAANALTIAFKDQSGAALGTLSLGDASGVQESIYARWEDDTPFLCWAAARELADVSADSLRDIRLLGIPVERIRRVKIRADDTMASFVIDRVDKDSPWLITKPLKTGANLEAVGTRLALIANMATKGFIDKPNGDVAAAFSGDSKTLSVWRHGERGPIDMKMAKSPDGKTAFAKVSDRNGVFTIDPGFLDALGLNPNVLRDRKLANFNPRSAAGIEIDAKPNFHVSLLLADAGWQVVQGEVGIPANRQRIVGMLKALAAEEVLDFVADAVGDFAPYGIDSPTMSITVKTIAQNPDQPTNEDGSPNLITTPITILVKLFQPADQPAKKLYATVKGSGTVVELSPSFHDLVPVRPDDFKSLYLWPGFSITSLSSLEVSAGVEEGLRLQYLKGINEWTGKLRGKDVTDRIDNLATLKLVQQLSLPLSATKWLSRDLENAEKALLEPSRRIKFELEDAAKKVFKFGIDIAPISATARGSVFYGRIHGSNAICLVDRSNVAILSLPLLKTESSPVPPPLDKSQPPLGTVPIPKPEDADLRN